MMIQYTVTKVRSPTKKAEATRSGLFYSAQTPQPVFSFFFESEFSLFAKSNPKGKKTFS